MKGEKLVSIIVPVYNSETFIGNCITSILQQTYGNIELLLINDGSADGSGKVCEAYAQRDGRIRVLHQENAGPSAARNRGIDAAKGTYIQFVDGDDTIEPHMTKSMVNALGEAHQLVICGFKNMLECSDQVISDEIFCFYKTGSFEKEELLGFFGELYRDYYIHFNWNKIYISEIIRENGLRFDCDVIRGEDMLFNLGYLEKCSHVKIIENPFYNYMTSNSGSITSTFRPDLFENQQLLFQRTREFLWRNHAYAGRNADLVEESYTTRIIACFSNLFHPRSTLSSRQIKKHILKIMWDGRVNEQLHYFAAGNFEKRLVGNLLEARKVEWIYWYFAIRSFLRKGLNAIGPESKKWI
ncbi:glycosyltransferase [Planomicrobium sp. CPCC 101110]|uniref:glycosyltransferase family 2 protein n=1 Tax=Planomicrobium sp. CPCC 101110 TaxID=2599619 RepID=UPI0011B767C4|nr:glycosyltransferase [Planomicrobium sp. CPCC 101110]TWT25127.1 glycosyltransferase [Planomicrobium sp. CPCC 101110]